MGNVGQVHACIPIALPRLPLHVITLLHRCSVTGLVVLIEAALNDIRWSIGARTAGLMNGRSSLFQPLCARQPALCTSSGPASVVRKVPRLCPYLYNTFLQQPASCVSLKRAVRKGHPTRRHNVARKTSSM